ncbi:hypothetical protein [Bacillus multifaciens]|uniref:hypothetical protein n=1 Tax=Bacillus multifaciens TaxID=3068506 RepID=UPI002741E0CC|nr:hypothetical protein [Bacillus sp. WLY-B-L8]MDP7981000.1 hypothetical protein [Bacillus sp. WLY-B-L8]
MIVNLDDYRRKKQKDMIKIPIVTSIYEENGEIKYEIDGYIDTPKDWIEGMDK